MRRAVAQSVRLWSTEPRGVGSASPLAVGASPELRRAQRWPALPPPRVGTAGAGTTRRGCVRDQVDSAVRCAAVPKSLPRPLRSVARRGVVPALFVLVSTWVGASAMAAEFSAGPDDYQAVVERLRAGDRLTLRPGVYTRGLDVHGLVGEARAPIVIEALPRTARFTARAGRNTVSIVDSAWVVLRGLTLDGGGLAVDAVKAEGHARWANHITLERLVIAGHGRNQQTVGISTKCPTRGWVVRGNQILGAGTGMYLGDSDGSAAFVGGLIEDNVVVNPIGYALQIKHQRERVAEPGPGGSPEAVETTVIRGNRFAKTANGRPDSPRPNVLVGDLPPEGPGSRDRYLIHGNLFFHNDQSVEALFQGEGNLAIYNNLFVNPHGSGVRLRPHNGQLRWAAVFRNTFVTAGMPVSVRGGAPGQRHYLEQNLVFSAEGVFSDVQGDNRAGTLEDAAARLVEPLAGRSLDLGPRSADVVQGGQPLPAELALLPGADRDFLGRERGASVYGACAFVEGAEARPCR